MKKTESLKMNYMFKRVYNKGRHFPGKYTVLYAASNGKEINRLGITASKKIGKSTRRNRIRRLIRESYRHIEEKLDTGYDLVFVARYAEVLPSFWEVKAEMEYLLRKAGIDAADGGKNKSADKSNEGMSNEDKSNGSKSNENESNGEKCCCDKGSIEKGEANSDGNGEN